MERRQRTRILSAAVLAVVFASGTLVGVAFQRSLASEQAVAGVPGPAPGSQEGGSRPRPPLRTPLYQQVLTGEQRVLADSIVEAVQARRDELERDFRRDMDSIFDASQRPQEYRRERAALTAELRAAIRALMTPEQLAQYDSILAADDARRAAERQERERLQQDREGAGRQERAGNPPN